MTTYKAPPPEKRLEYHRKAHNFLANQNPANMFVNCKSTSFVTVMEFLANGDGFTVYESAVGKPLERDEPHKWASIFNPDKK